MAASDMNFLQVTNLNIIAKLPEIGAEDRVQHLVHDVSFSMQKGRVLGLVGESGSGKTLTAKALMGILPVGIHRTGGEIAFEGVALPVDDDKAMQNIRGKRIAMLFQDPLGSFNPLHRIGRQIGEALMHHTACSAGEAHEKIIKMLSQVGIEEPERIMKSFPHQLSGGQRQRAMLAMALMTKPDLLIADEPTTALDAAIQLQVIRALQEVKNNVTLLVISHDLGMMRALADDLCVMQDGRIVERGPTHEVLDAPKHPYTQMLVQQAEKQKPIPLSADAMAVLDVKHLHVRYPLGSSWFWKKAPTLHAVNDISFTLKQGECLGIVGESGSGKSSLGLAALRLLASEGELDFMGTPLHALQEKALRPLRKGLQIVFQDPLAALNPRLTVAACIAEGLRAHTSLTADELDAKVCTAMKDVELDPQIRFRYPHEFSGGQCQRICIARVLVMEPHVVVFDEPTSSLDRNTQFQITGLIQSLQQRLGLACLFITHDLMLARALCHNVLVMQQGVCVEYATTQQLFTAPQHDYTKMLIQAASFV